MNAQKPIGLNRVPEEDDEGYNVMTNQIGIRVEKVRACVPPVSALGVLESSPFL